MIPLALKALSVARVHWKLASICLLALLLGIQTHRIALWKAHSASLEARNAQQVANYREAYSKAVATAYAEKAKKEASYEKAREESAEAYASLSDRYRAIVLRQAAANSRGTGKPDLPGNADTAGLPAEKAASSEFSISTADALICADNTAIAIGAFEWASGLQEPEMPGIY